MKICLVSRRFDKDSGSAEWIYAARLRDELQKKGFEISIIEQKNASIASSRIKKTLHDWINIPFMIVYNRIFKRIKLFHFLSENQAIFSFLARFIGAKTVTTFYDFMRLQNKEIYFYFIYKMASFSDKIICISSSTKDDIIRNYGISPEKIEIIPCVHHLTLHPAKKPKKGNVIGFLASLQDRKRPLLMIDLASIINQRKADLKIEIWGEGQLEEEMKNLIKKNKLEKIIYMRGLARYAFIQKIYNSFNFFVFPTAYEGLGLPIIEAMMCGLPVFVLEDAHIPKEVKDKCIVCKNMAEIFNKVYLLTKNKKRYNQIAQEALKNSNEFRFENALKNTINTYEGLA